MTVHQWLRDFVSIDEFYALSWQSNYWFAAWAFVRELKNKSVHELSEEQMARLREIKDGLIEEVKGV